MEIFAHNVLLIFHLHIPVFFLKPAQGLGEVEADPAVVVNIYHHTVCGAGTYAAAPFQGIDVQFFDARGVPAGNPHGPA